ncbi:MAG: hypothetical protein ABIO49_06150 [Dokdonella sp.]
MSRSLLTSRAVKGADAALLRAAARAGEIARRTGTPCWVRQDGRLVDLALALPSAEPDTRKTKRASAR